MLIVAPLSSHYATLLRHTVECLLPYYDIYITDWTDSRTVPLSEGRFDLDDYIDYLAEIFHFLGPNTHVLAVCQPVVPVAAVTALMEAQNDSCHPASMILIGGPIDASKSPTQVNTYVHSRGVPWFKANCVVRVPFGYAGFGRAVIPGFIQLSGFMATNLDRHMESHWSMFTHLLEGSGDSAEKQMAFYDEYLAVMDLPAEYFLQTVQEVFVDFSLARGTMKHRGIPIDLKKISRTALMTIEGERDDISGIGQTYAAHDLCSSIPKRLKRNYLQLGVGHYGQFSGSRFQKEVVPQIIDFTSMVEQHLSSKK
jgi:poly(3-hydroxybutyrate) depolymerase